MPIILSAAKIAMSQLAKIATTQAPGTAFIALNGAAVAGEIAAAQNLGTQSEIYIPVYGPAGINAGIVSYTAVSLGWLAGLGAIAAAAAGITVAPGVGLLAIGAGLVAAAVNPEIQMNMFDIADKIKSNFQKRVENETLSTNIVPTKITDFDYWSIPSMAIPPTLGTTPNPLLEFLITAMQTEFGIAQTTQSPLILDLDGDGVETIGTGAGVHFDHDGNRFGELSGWVGKDDGLLVWYCNGNGQIDSGTELFGNNTVLANGQKAANGFAALGDLDANHDGKMDTTDAAFASLRVWKDSNSDGLVDAGELLSLAQAGVKSIGTAFVSQAVTDASGNQHLQAGSFVSTAGQTRAITDVWFATDTARTVDNALVSVNATVAALPELAGFGNVHSLRQAMARDTSGVLQARVTQFSLQTDPEIRHGLMNEIIFRWAGVNDLAPTSRGSNISDARIISALEAFLGNGYIQASSGSASPAPDAANALHKAFDVLVSTTYNQLSDQTIYKPYYDLVALNWNNTTQSFELDASKVAAKLQATYAIDPDKGRALMYDFGMNLQTQDVFGSQLLTQLKALGNQQGTGFAFELSILGYKSISATASNDTLNGSAMPDLLDGGVGNDTLNGGTGNDTYRFATGSGVDRISEYDTTAGNTDTAQFSNVASTAVRSLERKAGDLVIGYGTADQLTLGNYFSGAAYQVEQFKFSDGVTWSQAEIKARVLTNGDAGNNYLSSFDDGSNRLYGLGGHDTLYGGAMADLLDGGAGDDTLEAGAGADILDGGVGNDTLNGGTGFHAGTAENSVTPNPALPGAHPGRSSCRRSGTCSARSAGCAARPRAISW